MEIRNLSVFIPGDPYRNWGDSANFYLMDQVTGAPHRWGFRQKQYAIGSVVDGINKWNARIWGSGSHFYPLSLDHINKLKEAKISALRGKLTKQQLLDDGVEVGEIPLGDAAYALDFSTLKRPSTQDGEIYIPHIDTTAWQLQAKPHQRLVSPTLKHYDFIEAVAGAKEVHSESLHGLILADSLGVPWRWIPSPESNRFPDKYHDWYSALNRRKELEPNKTFDPTPTSKIDKIRANLLEVFPHENVYISDRDFPRF